MEKKKFSIEWTEEVINSCYVEVYADSKEEALEKWSWGDYTEEFMENGYDQDERSNSFEKPCMNDINEIKE